MSIAMRMATCTRASTRRVRRKGVAHFASLTQVAEPRDAAQPTAAYPWPCFCGPPLVYFQIYALLMSMVYLTGRRYVRRRVGG